jgi:hypothetical protein
MHIRSTTNTHKIQQIHIRDKRRRKARIFPPCVFLLTCFNTAVFTVRHGVLLLAETLRPSWKLPAEYGRGSHAVRNARTSYFVKSRSLNIHNMSSATTKRIKTFLFLHKHDLKYSQMSLKHTHIS